MGSSANILPLVLKNSMLHFEFHHAWINTFQSGHFIRISSGMGRSLYFAEGGIKSTHKRVVNTGMKGG